MACYSHNYVAFAVIAQGVALLFQPGRGRLVLHSVLLMALAAVLWLPCAPVLLAQLSTPGNLSRMGESWQTQFAATPVVFAVGRTFAWRDAAPVMLGLGAAVAFVGWWVPAAAGLLCRPRPSRVAAPLLFAWVLLPVLVPIAGALAGNPVYHHRYGSVGLPAFLTLVAIGLTGLPPLWRRAAVVVIVAGTAYSLANYYRHPIKDDWRSASTAILDDAPPGQVVLTDSDFESIPFLYYARRQGAVPKDVYGLLVEKEGDRLLSVRYVDGTKQDKDPKDYTPEILSAPCVTIGLCMPVRNESFYRSLFETVLSATSSRSRGEVQQAFLCGPDFRLGQPGT